MIEVVFASGPGPGSKVFDTQYWAQVPQTGNYVVLDNYNWQIVTIAWLDPTKVVIGVEVFKDGLPPH